jgi:hypothetical protein
VDYGHEDENISRELWRDLGVARYISKIPLLKSYIVPGDHFEDTA